MAEPPDPSRLTFLVLGCQRCGTTWIDAALREHPRVFLPPQKQTYFFDRNFDRGADWYLANFAGAGPAHTAVGEVATGYCLIEAIPRVAAMFPDVRLIMTMRHPVERAYSYFLSRQAEMGWTSFEDALEREPDLLRRGEYIDQIEEVLRHYDRGQLLLLFFDDLSSNDRAFLASILRFLDLPEDFESSQFGRQRNSAMFPRLRRSLHRIGLKPALSALSRSPIGDAIRRAKKRSGKSGYKGVRPETRASLTEHFRPFNDRLAAFTNRDLTHWNQ